MVTTAAIVPSEAIKERPISYQVWLWSIPVITWILLIGVFIMANRTTQVTLVSADDAAFLDSVQSFLESENVPFSVDGNVITVDARERDEILRELSEQEWFESTAAKGSGDRSLTRLGRASWRIDVTVLVS